LSIKFLNNLNANGFSIQNVGAAVNANDVVTKAYVDAIAKGLDIKDSVKGVATTNIESLSGMPANFGGGVTPSFNYATLAEGDRVLLTHQTVASNNGIWVIGSGAWTRPADATVGAGGTLTAGSAVFNEKDGAGYVLAGTVFVNSETGVYENVGGATPYANSLWTKFTESTEINEGAGISLGANNAITVDTETAITSGQYVARKLVATITGDGEETDFIISGYDGAGDFTASVKEVTTGELVYPAVKYDDTNDDLVVSFGAAPALGKEYKVIVID
jgi:hypothetical protein